MTKHEELFKFPPATVTDTYTVALQELGLSVSELTRADLVLMHQLVLYVYAAAVGRMVAAVKRDGPLACNANPVVMQVMGEALQVLQEIEQVTTGEALTSLAPN